MVDEDAAEGCARSDVELALQRILATPEFQKNRTPAQFLKFVVEETLEGRGARLKAFTIANMALERDASFDAQNDSIVRVHAMRLRNLLQAYYAGPGASDPIRISLPLGSYQPAFERNPAPAAAPAPEAEAEPEPGESPDGSAPPAVAVPARKSGAFPPVWIAAALFAVSLAILAWFWPGSTARYMAERSDDGGSKPTVIVQNANDARSAADHSFLINRIVDRIENGLNAFDHFTTIRSSPGGEPAKSVTYAIFVRSSPAAGGRLDLSVELVRRNSSEIVWSRVFPNVERNDDAALQDIPRKVVTEVGGGVFGAITTDQLKRAQAAGKPTGYRCILSAYSYLRAQSTQGYSAARDCLDAQVAADPHDGTAASLLVVVLVRGYLDALPESRGGEDLQRASLLARRAYDEDPQRAPSSLGLFLTRFYSKNFSDAFIAARAALASNPNAPMAKAAIGAAYVSRGDFAAGLPLLSPPETGEGDAPNVYVPFVALAEYMRGGSATFERLAMRANARISSIGLVMRILACHGAGDEVCVTSASKQLRNEFRGFSSDLGAAFDRYAFSDEIKARLLADMKAAGFRGAGCALSAERLVWPPPGRNEDRWALNAVKRPCP